MPLLRERKKAQPDNTQAESETTITSEIGEWVPPTMLIHVIHLRFPFSPDDDADSDYEEAQRFKTRPKRPAKPMDHVSPYQLSYILI
jgi:hypothetical protein